MSFIRGVYLIITVYMLTIIQMSTEKTYTFEFGSVFRQKVASKASSFDHRQYRDVIQWSEKYIHQRASWSIPWLWEEQQESPDILDFKKVNLMYTHNDKDPLHFDSHVYDQYGQEQGITRLVTFGAIYRFILSWSKRQLTFVHNVTVSEYPRDTYNMYSHTFYIQHINSSSNKLPTYLLPKNDKHQIKTAFTSQNFGDFEKHLEVQLDKFHSNDKNPGELKPVLDDHMSEHCGDGVHECPKNGFQYRYSKFQQDGLTVMSYNVWNMNSLGNKPGSYTKRMKQLKQTILDADPDIIGLQEMRYEESKGEDLGPNQMAMLSKWLPEYQYVFQPAQMQPNSLHEGRTEEGVAIMSRYPIVSHDYVLLFINRNNSADTHQRILLHVEIIVPVVGKIHVLNTHLSLSHEAREKSVVEICRYISLLEGQVILLGDMNAEPNEPAMKYLNGQDILPGVTNRCMLKDVWLETEQDKPGFTYNSLEKKLHKRIDYILHTGWQSCCKVKTIKVHDDGSRGLQAASDHCPLVAMFSLQKKDINS